MVAGLALLSASCAFTPAEDVPQVARADARPVRNVTSFSESLRCMDRLFANFGVRDVVVTSQGIPDATGEIETGTKEMLISAISRMSTSSGAFVFVDFDQTQFDVNALQDLVGFTDNFVVPNYYIRGAITQLDEGVVAETVGGGLSFAQADVGASVDQVYSLITVDTNVGDLLTRQILTGTSASNALAVRRRGFAVDGGAALDNPTLGVNLTLSFNNSEGVHQAVRTLVELSTVESLGRLTQVPYWRCLGIEQTNPAIEDQARGWFTAMGREGQVSFVQLALAGQGFYDGPVTGRLDPATRESVGAYQAANGLIADGRVDFDLYASLISGDLALGRRPDPKVVPAVYEPAATRAAQPLALTLTTPRGDKPVFAPGELLQVQVRPNRDAFVYCYYEAADGNIARILPNRFQPNALAAGLQELRVPAAGSPFEITLDEPGSREEILCLASSDERGMALPPALREADLAPLPVASLGDLVDAFQNVSVEPLVVARLPIQVAGP
ncbi:MAG: DUF4384 domain-containing protein [Geminicoccaceae bacterium]|nr:DUF4384 domain-containing protein [Geminicoccaceae bacterium]